MQPLDSYNRGCSDDSHLYCTLSCSITNYTLFNEFRTGHLKHKVMHCLSPKQDTLKAMPFVFIDMLNTLSFTALFTRTKLYLFEFHVYKIYRTSEMFKSTPKKHTYKLFPSSSCLNCFFQ